MAMSTPSDPSVPPGSEASVTGTYVEEVVVPAYPPPSTEGAEGGGGGGAAQRAQEAAATAKDEGRSVASTATDQARSVAETAKDQARNVSYEARTQAQRVAGDVRGEVQSQLDQRVGQAAERARTTGEQLRALAEGRVDEAGPAADWARQAGDQVQQLSERINDLGIDGAAQEVRRFARQRPLVFIAGAAAAGFLVGRTMKNASGASQNQGGRQGVSGSNGSNGRRYATQPVGGIDPYGTEFDRTIPSQAGGQTSTIGSPLATEVTPLGGAGGVVPPGEPQ